MLLQFLCNCIQWQLHMEIHPSMVNSSPTCFHIVHWALFFRNIFNNLNTFTSISDILMNVTICVFCRNKLKVSEQLSQVAFHGKLIRNIFRSFIGIFPEGSCPPPPFNFFLHFNQRMQIMLKVRAYMCSRTWNHEGSFLSSICYARESSL